MTSAPCIPFLLLSFIFIFHFLRRTWDTNTLRLIPVCAPDLLSSHLRGHADMSRCNVLHTDRHLYETWARYDASSEKIEKPQPGIQKHKRTPELLQWQSYLTLNHFWDWDTLVILPAVDEEKKKKKRKKNLFLFLFSILSPPVAFSSLSESLFLGLDSPLHPGTLWALCDPGDKEEAVTKVSKHSYGAATHLEKMSTDKFNPCLFCKGISSELCCLVTGNRLQSFNKRQLGCIHFTAVNNTFRAFFTHHLFFSINFTRCTF